MFNESVHAFISAVFYKQLVDKFPNNGEKTFILATQRYGEQRGSRMAQRTIRDGRELDFINYNKYGEWSFTRDDLSSTNLISLSPHYHYEVFKCPWHEQFKKMDALTGARVYCDHIDKAISRGFNPCLQFEVNKVLHTDGYCDFVQKNANIDKNTDISKNIENEMPFTYHCGHIFKTFSEVIKSIYKEEGVSVIDNVKEELLKEYGQDMLDELLSYEKVDFNYLP